MKTNHYEKGVFWDMDDYWLQHQCQYPKCDKKAVGRVNSGATKKYDVMGYMLVCKDHLNEFRNKYGV